MLTGLCCLQDSGCVAVPQLPGALSAGPVQPGRVSWAVFCGAPAPRRASDRRFARAWPAPTATGTKGMWCMAARSSRPALPKPLPRDPGSVSQPWGDRRGLGVHVSRELKASLPLGTWKPHGDSRVARRLLQDGAGQRQSPELRVPTGVPCGEMRLSRASKSSPAVSGDPKGTEDLGIASCRTLEPCQLPAGLQQPPQSRASPGQRGEKPAQPMAAPDPAGCPGAPARLPAPVCTAGTGLAPREALRLCLLSTW